ncbi:hypothetical protein [Planctomycetes bacterium K23_9]|uniref:Uncharacterized protein n=1 Tax=Stieleria marina TaxID=1930275 RepID=A0A517NPM8_9BACT|nr:hypothetical protein K239x_10120 [Planctomycetes bacterium K23_9]
MPLPSAWPNVSQAGTLIYWDESFDSTTKDSRIRPDRLAAIRPKPLPLHKLGDSGENVLPPGRRLVENRPDEHPI